MRPNLLRRMPSSLTVERVRELLHYEIVTGRFYWKVDIRQMKAGARTGRLPSNHGYLSVRVDGSLYRCHRLAHFWVTGEWPPADVDHINRDKTCNAWHNLRPASRSENNCNAHTRNDNTSGAKGVSFNKRSGKWMAYVSFQKKRTYLGLFPTCASAAEAVHIARETLHGGYARH